MAFDDRPFQDRDSYAQCHRCLAVNLAGEVVRVVDWQRDDPNTNLRIFIVKLCDPEGVGFGLAWHEREDRLAPVPAIEGAIEAADAWRAEQSAKTLNQDTERVQPTGAMRRI